MFYVYAALMGFTLSSIFMVYDLGSIGVALGVTAAFFFALAISRLLGGVVIRRVVLRVVLPVVLGLLTECHNRSFSVCSSTNLRGTKLNIP